MTLLTRGAVLCLLLRPAALAAAQTESGPVWRVPAAPVLSPTAGLTLDRPLPALVFAGPLPALEAAAAPSGASAVLGPGPAPARAPAAAAEVRVMGRAPELAAASFEGTKASAAPAPEPAGREGSAPRLERPSDPPPEGGDKPPARASKAFALHSAAAVGLSLGALAPFATGERPAHFLLFTLAAAWASYAALASARLVFLGLRRLVLGPREAEPESPSAWRRGARTLGAVGAGLALGAGLGLWPNHMAGPVIEAGARVYAPEARVEVLGREMPTTLAVLLKDNAEGREILRGLKDRDGTVVLPHFFVGDVGARTPLRYVPALDSVFVDPAFLRARGWEPGEFARREDLQRRLAIELKGEGARELFRAAQARRPFGALLVEQIPLTGGLMEAEYEAALSKHRFVHEALKDESRPELTREDLSEYEAMLDDLKGSLRALDAEPRHAGYAHEYIPYFRQLLLRAGLFWPEHAVEGYRLLAERAESPAEKARLLAKRRARAVEEGVEPPRIEDLR